MTMPSVSLPLTLRTCDHPEAAWGYQHTDALGSTTVWCGACGSLGVRAVFAEDDEPIRWCGPGVPQVPTLPAPALAPAPILSAEILALVESHKGIFLDVGCSDHKSAGSVGMDKRALPGVDICHDIEVLPWPLPDACVSVMLMSHLVEHLKPWLTIDIMNEAWRVTRPGGQLCIATPYAGAPRFWQDPTHMHGWMEATAQYFDCAYPLWEVYRPCCWEIEVNEWKTDMNIVLRKRDTAHGPYHAHPSGEA